MQSEVQNRPRPVLMIPLRRCGSHALRLRLNFSPDFYSPYPLHLVDFMPLLRLCGDLNSDDNYFQLVVDLAGLQTASLVKWPMLRSIPYRYLKASRTARAAFMLSPGRCCSKRGSSTAPR